MAVKQLMLRMQLKTKTAELDALRALDESFITRKAEIETREDALSAAIDEAQSDEEKAAVEAATPVRYAIIKYLFINSAILCFHIIECLFWSE